MAVKYSIENNIEEIYLTHFTKSVDSLTDLITKYGFKAVAKKKSGEDVYVKEMFVSKAGAPLDPLVICKQFYPSFCDGLNVKKFIVPIRPEYHNKLFTDFKRRQTSLTEFAGGFIIEGNTIEKAYLCHSNITTISPGDILIFYRSQDIHEITSIGVAEEIHRRLRDKDEVTKLVGKRTVYSPKQIEEMVKKPTTVIIFTWSTHLTNPLNLADLKKMGILPIQLRSISQIPHATYLKIKGRGEIDERFTVT